MSNSRLRCLAALILWMLGWVPSVDARFSTLHLDLELRPSQPQPGGTAELEIVVSSLRHLPEVMVEVTLAGDREPLRRDTVGPLASGAPSVLSVPLALPLEGRRTIQVTAQALRPPGELNEASRATLYLEVQDGVAWHSRSGFVDLEIEQLKAERAATAMDAQVYARRMEAIVGGRAETRPTPKSLPRHAKHDRDRSLHRQVLARLGRAENHVNDATAAGTITVKGRALWSDIADGTHEVRFNDVEIWDHGPARSRRLVSARTDEQGRFSVVVANTDDDGDGVEVFVRVIAEASPYYVVRPRDGTPYFVESTPQAAVADGSAVDVGDVIAGKSRTADTALGIGQAMVEAALYSVVILGVPPAPVNVIYPADETLMPLDKNDQIEVSALHASDWDALQHEYGHFTARKLMLQGEVGGLHGAELNLSEELGKFRGVRVAWGEGLATFYALSMQQEMGVALMNIPGAGDLFYDQFLFTHISMESSAGCTACFGEDNEVAIWRALWDLYDEAQDPGDEVALGDEALWKALMSDRSTIDRLSWAWEALIKDRTVLEQTQFGRIFTTQRIAPDPQSPAPASGLADNLVFKWRANGGGKPTSNRFKNDRFRVKFYNADFTKLLLESAEIEKTRYALTAMELQKLRNAKEPVIRWLVEGRATDPFTTGIYISRPETLNAAQIAFVIDDTGSMSEEIREVQESLRTLIEIEDPQDFPTIAVITFKDDVRLRTVSSDPGELGAVVDSLRASGGGDCAEASVAALNLAAGLLQRGSVIYLFTDASPHLGGDRDATIAALNGKGIRTFTLLSGDCVDLDRSPLLGNSSNRDGFLEAEAQRRVESAVVVFSDIAAATGGVFAFLPEVNRGGVRYANVARNLMQAVVRPSLLLASPAGVPRGGSVVMGLRGSDTNFNATSRAVFASAGIGVETLDVVSPTAIVLRVSAEPAVPLGPVDVAVETQVGDTVERAEAEGAVEVVEAAAGPTVAGVVPAELALGEAHEITVSGVSTHFDDSSELDLGAGVTVHSLQARSSTEISARVTVGAVGETEPGFRSVRVTTGAEIATEDVPGPLLLLEKAGRGLPRITAIEPRQVEQGTDATLLLSGENTAFDEESRLYFGGSGLSVQSIKIKSPTRLRAAITLAPEATAGFRDVFVTSGRQTAASLGGLEIVGRGGAPRLVDVEPTKVAQGATARLTIAGRNTHFANARTGVRFESPGLVVSAVEVLGPELLQAVVTVDVGARLGFHTMTVITGPESVTAVDALEVEPAPVAIPTIGAYSLMILALAVALAGALLLRR